MLKEGKMLDSVDKKNEIHKEGQSVPRRWEVMKEMTEPKGLPSPNFHWYLYTKWVKSQKKHP